MKSKKLKKVIVIGVLLQAVCIALLLSIVFGKYTKEIHGYSKFEVEKFNAAILPVTTGDGQSSMTVTWTAQDFFPGMTMNISETNKDTSARTAFRVANGRSEADATTLSLQYSIRIRTSNSLPLKYTLYDGVNYYPTLGEPTPIETEETNETRYEYIFGTSVSTVDDGASQGEQAQQGEEATFILEKQPPEEGEEATAGNYVERQHELIAEWPCKSDETGSTASIAYMKEVEIVEILVIVTTANENEENKPPVIPESNDYYSDGIIIIKPEPPAQTTPKLYTHTVDLRAFKPQPGSAYAGAFNFTIDNAVGQSAEGTIENMSRTTKYHMQLKVPAGLIPTENATSGYVFTLFRNDVPEAERQDLMSVATVKYRVYDEKLGTYGVYNEATQTYEDVEYESLADAEAAMEALIAQATDKEKDKYKIYYIYDIVVAELINFTLDGNQEPIPNRDYHGYTLTINNLPSNTKDDLDLVFLNKLEILVDAPYAEVADNGNNNENNNENGGEE